MVIDTSRRSRSERTSEASARFLKIRGGEPQYGSRESTAVEVKICRMFRPDLPCSASRTYRRRGTYIRIGEGSVFQNRRVDWENNNRRDFRDLQGQLHGITSKTYST